MKNYKIILTVLLIGITVFSVFKYVLSIKEKHDLLHALDQVKSQVAALENEKQNLLQAFKKEKELRQQLSEENTGLKSNLKASEEKIAKLDTDFRDSHKAIEQLNYQLSALKAENTALKQGKDNLDIQVAKVTQEKDSLKARLSSIAELKKAIKELRHQMRKGGGEIKRKVKPKPVRFIETKPVRFIETKPVRFIEGNRGFLIRDGRPTYPAKIKIKVTPVP